MRRATDRANYVVKDVFDANSTAPKQFICRKRAFFAQTPRTGFFVGASEAPFLSFLGVSLSDLQTLRRRREDYVCRHETRRIGVMIQDVTKYEVDAEWGEALRIWNPNKW